MAGVHLVVDEDELSRRRRALALLRVGSNLRRPVEAALGACRRNAEASVAFSRCVRPYLR